MAQSDTEHNDNTYVIDTESATEMGRLLEQDRAYAMAIGSVFPERDNADMEGIERILDIACGPGGWVHDVAYEYPQIEVTGIDISRRMIAYAQAQSRVRQLSNAHFQVMDILKPLEFPDASFDLINMRFGVAFMPPTAWPTLVRECKRVLRPGGVLRLTEFEAPITTSNSFDKGWELLTQSLLNAGQSLTTDGRAMGITPLLRRFLQDADYRHIGEMAHVINFSYGTPAYQSMYENFMVAIKLGRPFVVKWGNVSDDYMETLYQQTQEEMQSESFCGVSFFLTAWGTKPV